MQMGLKHAEAETVLEIVNDYVLDEPVSEKELQAIMRIDENGELVETTPVGERVVNLP